MPNQGECECLMKKSSSSDPDLERVFHGVAMNVQEELEGTFGPTSTQRVIILSGPTGAGKTTLSLELARKMGGEIISADSMQVYRGMDIGTAKATLEDRNKTPHHLVDCRDINELYNVKEFFQEAMCACKDILLRGRVPIVVGGTGFYIHSLLYGPPSGPACNPEIRKKLLEEEDKFGPELLLEKLTQLDPIYAKTITKNDRHKILRALEIIEVSGRKVSDFPWRKRALLPNLDMRCWFVYYPRKILYHRLEERCEEMLAQGLLEEVVHLDRLGIRNNSTASSAIGYKQTLDFLNTAQTEADYKNYVEKLKQATRHLAKRQFTWFRREPVFRWLDRSQLSNQQIIDIIVDDYESKSKTCSEDFLPPKDKP